MRSLRSHRPVVARYEIRTGRYHAVAALRAGQRQCVIRAQMAGMGILSRALPVPFVRAFAMASFTGSGNDPTSPAQSPQSTN